MSTITIDTTALSPQILAMLEAGGLMKAAKKSAKGRKMPKGLKAAKQHCYAARMDRRHGEVLGGLTKVERVNLAATLPEGYSHKQWVKAVVFLKAAEGITFSKKAIKAA